MLIRRVASLLAFAGAATAATLALTALPAAAHVEIKADKNQAGATDVTISFEAENESAKASIVSVRVALPPGIAPADVTLASGPAGWTMTPADDGFTVGGAPLGVKKNAEYAIKVARLPVEAKTLPFKTLVNYSDGKVDRWIDVPENGGQSDNPAPTLTLGAPVAAPTSAAASSASPTAAATTAATPVTTEAAPVPQAETASKSGGSGALPWIIVGLLVVLAAGGLVAWRLRGRNRQTS